jgi:hypothetical protein
LVQAKKTQRDKDWFMLRRLVLAHFAQNRAAPTPEHIDFWLREAREVAMLLELARTYPERAAVLRQARPLLAAAGAGDAARLCVALDAEEQAERQADREYWRPLRVDLEALRHDAASRDRPGSAP